VGSINWTRRFLVEITTKTVVFVEMFVKRLKNNNPMQELQQPSGLRLVWVEADQFWSGWG